MMLYGLSEQDIQQIHTVFARHLEVQEAIIFGSRAMGHYKKGSDIDIALKGDLDDRLIAAIKAELEEETPLPYFFDVISYHSIDNESLIHHIQQYGKSIYTLNKSTSRHRN